MKINSRHLMRILPHAIAAVLLAPLAAQAAGVTGGDGFTNPIAAEDLSTLLKDILRVVIMLGAIVVVFFYILAGFKYVTARGDSKQISSAHATLTWTTVGAFVVLGAQVIATAIEGTVRELGK